MKWIGITGGIGTGKSSTCKIIAKNLWPTLEADHIIRETILQDKEIKNRIVDIFGKDIVDQNKKLNRKKIASKAFLDEKKLTKLEKIIHPKLAKLVQIKKDKLKQEGHKMAFYEVPLLFEKQMQNQFDATILIASEQNLVIERLLEKGLGKTDILNRMKHQLPQTDKLPLATYVIWNNSSLDELKKACKKVLTDIAKKNDKH